MTVSSPLSTAASVAGLRGVNTKASHATHSTLVAASVVVDPPTSTEQATELLRNLILSTATTLKPFTG
jgi:hypothetical protein